MRVIGFVVAAIAIACVVWVGGVAKPWATPESVLKDFSTNASAEDMMMDPLILGGRKVVPIVIMEVPRREMPRRRYAIGFLGNGGYVEAIQTLTSILADENDDVYVRSDALKAIFQISPSDGLALAQRYSFRQDSLGNMARQVIDRTQVVTEKRSYLDALFGIRR